MWHCCLDGVYNENLQICSGCQHHNMAGMISSLIQLSTLGVISPLPIYMQERINCMNRSLYTSGLISLRILMIGGVL